MNVDEETAFSLSLTSCRPQNGGFQQRGERDNFEIERELTILREWGQIQKEFLSSLSASPVSDCSWRSRIDEGIDQATHGQACIWWEPLSDTQELESCHLVEIRHQQIRYGMLKLSPGYLVSHIMPDIHYSFGLLCATIINLFEHQALAASLLKSLHPLHGNELLTPREKNVLEGIVLGEREYSTAQRLGIALTTVRTHRHNMYRSLEVHSPQEAVLRSFELRLLAWLDLPCDTRQTE